MVQTEPPPVSLKKPTVAEIALPLSSVEQCYNGWDDNQNGLIDEGCAIPQASVQVVLAWQAPHADLDLFVYDPKGELPTPQAPTGSFLCVHMDCPSDDECPDQPFEMVYNEGDEYVGGAYTVRVLARTFEEDQTSLVARLGIKTPEGTRAYRLEFYDEGQSVQLNFDVAEPTQSE